MNASQAFYQPCLSLISKSSLPSHDPQSKKSLLFPQSDGRLSSSTDPLPRQLGKSEKLHKFVCVVGLLFMVYFGFYYISKSVSSINFH